MSTPNACDIYEHLFLRSFRVFSLHKAQKDSYVDALQQLRPGQKRTHWMWFIFPQVGGLGFSAVAQQYAIGSRVEAEAYLTHSLLGERLRACVDALLEVEGRSAEQMGDPDFLKLQSSITLFGIISPTERRFEQLLEKYYGRRRDQKTINFLT